MLVGRLEGPLRQHVGPLHCWAALHSIVLVNGGVARPPNEPRGDLAHSSPRLPKHHNLVRFVLKGFQAPLGALFWDGVPTKAGTREDCSDLINTLTHLTLYFVGIDPNVYSGIGLQQLKVQGCLYWHK